jgi:hypothetical protein
LRAATDFVGAHPRVIVRTRHAKRNRHNTINPNFLSWWPGSIGIRAAARR